MSTTDKVIEIVAKQLKRDPTTITVDTDLAEAGYESLDVIETIFAIEEEWDIDVNFNANSESIDNFKTVGDVVKMVDAVLAAKGLA
ncbi:Acyl carrier protein [Sphingobium yanoikuyae]|uniref:Acyl carrier protein n=1 Tax=Sphingobium yanoikuyae TaxID=13690 RepID=A0A084EBE3_SPHYA|nr:phosphopantetheine-binding protein [Sphingobium yanoikuyae]KEZ15285.1 Acyl carrier protein [Sphingobium yanoikuyae]